MRTTAGSSLLAALAAALLIPVQVVAQEVPSGAVVLVGAQPIARVTFDHWLRVAALGAKLPVPRPPRFFACMRALPHSVPTSRRRARCRAEYRRLRDPTLQFLISAAWIEGETLLQGVAVTAAEIDAEFAVDRRAQFPTERAFHAYLRGNGLTVADLRLRVRLQLLSERLRERVMATAAPVTDADVAAYYAAHRDNFRIPLTRDLRIVHTRFAWRARRARELLGAGVPWARVARLLSVDGRSRRRGVARSGDAALDRAIVHARRMRVTGPVRTAAGYYVFEVTRVHPGRVESQEQVAPTIRAILESGRREAVLGDFVRDFQRRWTSVTVCRRGFVALDCGAAAP